MPINNFGVVSSMVYRGGQPDEEGVRSLAKLGVVSILKLNSEEAEQEAKWCASEAIELVNEPIPTLINSLENVRSIAAMIDAFDKRESPMYLHCEHGRDRTGLIVAAYRIIHRGWTFEEAEEERKLYGVDGLIRFFDADMDVILKQLAEVARS